MPRRHYLRYWRDFALPQARAANHQIGHEPEQAVINIGGGRCATHCASPWDWPRCPKTHSKCLLTHCFLFKNCEEIHIRSATHALRTPGRTTRGRFLWMARYDNECADHYHEHNPVQNRLACFRFGLNHDGLLQCMSTLTGDSPGVWFQKVRPRSFDLNRDLDLVQPDCDDRWPKKAE